MMGKILNYKCRRSIILKK